MRLALFLVLLLSSTGVLAAPAVAFFYGTTPPYEELTQFDWVVLQPNHSSAEGLQQLTSQASKAIAYLSIGEMADVDAASDDFIDARLAANAAWGSRVMDLTSDKWRNHLLAQASTYAQQGFKGLFFDTLDSFNLAPAEVREAQRQALISVLEALHQQHPELLLIFNRGFEVLGDVSFKPDAVAVESLEAGWNAATGEFRSVPAADQAWLAAQLQPLQAKEIPIIALEYLPAAQREAREQLAKRLIAQGFIPWIATPELDTLGQGALRVEPRRIAVLYDQREGLLAYNAAHTLLGGLLEYLGYRVDYFAADQGLLAQPLHGLYAGVVVWMTSGAPANSVAVEAWLSARITEGVPLAFMAGMPVQGNQLLSRLGLKPYELPPKRPLELQVLDEQLWGFEGKLKLRTRGLSLFTVASAGRIAPLLQLSDAAGSELLQAGLAEWGGFVLNPYVLEQGGASQQRWLIDPFAFLQKALRLQPQPVAEFSTENGRRIATVHLDGDGFLSRVEVPGSPYAGQYVLDTFIRGYPGLLHSVSVIEGEVGPKGQFPHLARELEPIAREIFAEDTVEVASHSYSHPFFWRPEVAGQREGFNAEYGYHMPIHGYKLDFKREIIGSRDYINSRLTTPQKPVKVMFWSGDALPNEETLRLTYGAGLGNINGAVTKLTNAYPSLTGLYPMIRPVNGVLQFYAPIMNENVYTNLWTGPYYGFRELQETFELTNQPRRLRPLSLYYHFYAGTELASIRVMHDLYRYIEQQQPMPLWISQYLTRLEGFYRASVAQTLSGAYQLRNLRGLRTLRVPSALGWPDLRRSKNVAGAFEDATGRYIHLSADNAVLYLQASPSDEISLVQANLPLTAWRRLSATSVRVGFSGFYPLQFSVRGKGSCALTVNGQRFTGQRQGQSVAFSLPYTSIKDGRLDCR